MAFPRLARNPKTTFSRLPKIYRQSPNGITLKLIDRTDNAAIYKSRDSRTWEVFKIRIGKEFFINRGGERIKVPNRERVPGNEDFGKWAWSFGSRKGAFKKYNEIK